MRARLEAWVRSLGAAGVLGIGVLVASAGFWTSTLGPLREEIAAQRAALERLRARTPYRLVTAAGPAEELRRFYELFPPAARLTDELDRLHRLGRRAGLELAQGEYRLEKGAAGLWSYRVTLPVRGSYEQVRDFAAAILREMPVASLDALRFERKKALDPELEAQLRLTLHLRPAGGTP